ncbi:carboxymethylenebutenolidase [Microbispora rosea]|uniref:Carboxymethylenebutenolidase n=1 Tax=Microbispora rosea TaxID=58117 RepID=A0A1N6UT08_9ACTN|nr:carboxymethylenebutenolidase [Microbispora rosea]
MRAAMDHLRARGCARVGMVGLSVGGHVAYLAAARLDLAAVAVAYGG